MPKFYEVIYETGNMSVLSVDNEDDAKDALKEQHKRAMQGKPGQLESSSSPHPFTGEYQPQTHAAERVKRVLVYDQHPADLAEQTNAHKDVFSKHIKALIAAHTDENGIVDRDMVAQGLYVPTVNPDAGAHESKYTSAAEAEELSLDFLED